MGRRKTKQSNNVEIVFPADNVNGESGEVSNDCDPLDTELPQPAAKSTKSAKSNSSKGSRKLIEAKKDDEIEDEAHEIKSSKGSQKPIEEKQNQEDEVDEEDEMPLTKYEKAPGNKKGKRKSANTKNGLSKKHRALVEEEKLEEEEEVDYEVEKIVDVRYLKSGAREFLIRWKGCGPKGDTWEPEDNLSCSDLITKFLNKKTTPKKKNNIRKEVSSTDTKPDPESEYEVEKIIEVHHKRNGGKEFLIRWKGCSSKDDSWEPEENLCCPDLIAKFMARVSKLSNFEQREVRSERKHTDRFTLTMQSQGRRTSKRNKDKQRTTYYDAE